MFPTEKVIKIAKGVGKIVLTIGVPLLDSYLSKKARQDEITKEVAKALAEAKGGES